MLSITIKRKEGLTVKYNEEVIKGVDSVMASYDFITNEPKVILTIKPLEMKIETDDNYASTRSTASADRSI